MPSPTLPARSIRWRDSLRVQMLGIAAAATLAAWTAGGVATWLSARQANQRLLDERLAQVAHTVVSFTEHELAEIGDKISAGMQVESGVYQEADASLDNRYQFQIWSADGRLLLRSQNAPKDSHLAAQGSRGFGQGMLLGQPARTYAYDSTASRVSIEMAEPVSRRESSPGVTGGAYLLSFVVSSLLICAAAWWLVLRALSPLKAAEHSLRTRPPFDLTPLAVAGAPSEIKPMLDALNALFERVETRMSQERGFTAMAAHELRTPLGALRMQAQVASLATTPQQRELQLAALIDSVDRCAHLLEQLLTLNRVDEVEAGSACTWVDLNALVQNVIDSVRAQALARGIRVEHRLAVQTVWGHAFSVQTLVRNLVANAVRAAAPNGVVRISADATEDHVVLRVDDNGPGIAPPERERAFERFVRLGSTSAGVGLGLSIAQAVARSHHARIELLDSPLGGLRAEVRFPPPPAR